MAVVREGGYWSAGGNRHPLIREHSALGGFIRWLRWIATLLVLVLVIHLICVVWIWDDGLQSLASVLLQEKAILGLQPNTAPARFVDTLMVSVHEWVFIKTGLGHWLSAQRTGFLAAIINGLWVIVETAILGLQLFALRFAVLVLSLPLFIVVGATAVTDGVYGWLMRRTNGASESGFIYHRAKRAFPVFLLLVWAVYLLPPMPLDPRWIIPPFVVMFAIALRFQVVFFKKHI